MSSSETEKGQVDALIAQLNSSHDNAKIATNNIRNSSSAISTSSERKRVYIRQNSGSNSDMIQFASSPTDARKRLLHKNVKMSKKNYRKSRKSSF